MEVTEVRINRLEGSEYNPHFLAGATVCLDNSFAVRDIRIIRSDNGNEFLQMPDRRRTEGCPECNGNIGMGYHYCPWCGLPMEWPQGMTCREVFQNVCFPTNQEFRKAMTENVLAVYYRQKEQANERPK